MRLLMLFAIATMPVLASGKQGVRIVTQRVYRDIAYAEPRNERQMLDVYAPLGAKNRPIVFWIHGAGWQKGDKTEMDAKPQAFTEKGYVFATTNYRFIPNVTMQQIAGDVAKSIRWVYDHAAEYGGDPQTIFVMGWSAGAQLTALICADDRYLKAERLALANIKGCVPVDAIKFPQGSDRELSSVLYVKKDERIPPFLILHIAGHPESGTAIQARVLANALKVAGVPVQVVAAQGKTHSTLNSELGLRGDIATKAVFDFLDGILKERGPSVELRGFN